MVALDVRTTFLLYGLLQLVLALGAWAASAEPRKSANIAWFGGGVLVGLGLLLLGLRGVLSDWIARDLGQLLVPAGGLQLLHATHLELGRRWISARALLGMLAVASGYFALLSAGQELLARQLGLTVEVALLLALIVRLLQLRRLFSLSSYNWIAFGFTSALLGVSVRGAALWAGYSPVEPIEPLRDIARMPPDVMFMLLACLLTAVTGNLGWLGIELQRAAHKAARMAADRARQEYGALLMDQIAHLERRSSLGEMATTLAHEVKQPLTAILSNIQVAQRMARRSAADDQDLAEALGRAVNNTRLASEIVARVGGYVRPAAPQRLRVDVQQLVQGVVHLVVGQAQQGSVRLHMHGWAESGTILADPVQISQIVLNLLRNAMQAVQEMGLRDIHVSLQRHANEVDISVRDTGPGLTSEVAARAGTPFFTTRPDGMGVGLSISSSIAIQHGGRLRIANAPGGGALAILTLPLTAQEAAQERAPAGTQAKTPVAGGAA